MAHLTTIQFYRGVFGSLPTLAAGEPGWCTDTYQLYVGDGATNHLVGGGSGDVVGPGSATDNAIARFDTTTGKLIQNSAVTVDDTGVMAGGTWNGVVIGNVYGGTGTDSSAASGIAHVTAGSWTFGAIDLTADVTGILPDTNGGLGIDASGATAGYVPVYQSGGPFAIMPVGTALYAPTTPGDWP